VYIDPVIRSRDDPADTMLLGLIQGGTVGNAKLMRDVWRHGSYAEYCGVPLENVIRLDEERLRAMGYRDSELAGLGSIVPFGRLIKIGVGIGETFVVTPATGVFGGAAPWTTVV
jgi:hypothetical protein